MKTKNILIIAAHPDDEVLGCGGTIARLAMDGCNVYTLILGEGVTSRSEERDRNKKKKELSGLKKELKNANKILGVKKTYIYEFPDNRFDTVPMLDIIKVIEKIPPVVNSPNHLLGQDGIHLNTITKHQRDLEELFLPWRDEIEIDIKILIGKPFLEIVREVLNNGHDLVIKTAQTAGLYARVFGNSDIDLLRKCPCPVWLVNEIGRAHV